MAAVKSWRLRRRMHKPMRTILFATVLLLASPLRADSNNSLQTFFDGLQSFSADFEQHVVDDNDEVLQSSSGRVWIKQPGRFRWDYLEPYQQQIVADGERLWTWDRDLEQVTVQPADEVITATPAMLLSDTSRIYEVFDVTHEADGRVRLVPNTDDSNVTGLDLYFRDGVLAQISAQDTFGNTTHFSFSRLDRNPQLANDLFVFEPPAGADIVGDTE